MLKIKLWAFLKQTQSRVIVNQYVPTVCMEAESKQEHKEQKKKKKKKKWQSGDRIIGDIKNLFEQEEEDYYKPVRLGDFYRNHYIVYESNGYRNKALSIEEYLNEIKSYLKNITNNLKKSDSSKIQMKTAVNFILSKVTNEEHVMHSKSDSIETMIYDKVGEVV